MCSSPDPPAGKSQLVRRLTAPQARRAGRKLIGNPPVIQLFGSGEETRDFVYVEDAVELVSACAAAASCEPLVVNG